MGRIKMPSHGKKSPLSFSTFIREVLSHNSAVPGQVSKQIAESTWRVSTQKGYNQATQNWFLFCNTNKVDPFDLSVKSMLSALDFVANKLHLSYRQVEKLSTFCSNVRKLGGKPLSDTKLKSM